MTNDLTKAEIKRGTDCIGVSVSFICHDDSGKILLHKRSANCRDEQGKWDNGGGALEFGESFEEAVRREVKEEYCVEARDILFLAAYNRIREHNGQITHWVIVLHGVRVDPAEVKNGEPEKIDEIGWFSSDALPSPGHTALERTVRFAQEAGVI